LATLGNIAANDSIVIEQDSILPLQYKDSIAVDTAFNQKSFNRNAFNYHFSYYPFFEIAKIGNFVQ